MGADQTAIGSNWLGQNQAGRMAGSREIPMSAVWKGREVSLQFGRCSAILSKLAKIKKAP